MTLMRPLEEVTSTPPQLRREWINQKKKPFFGKKAVLDQSDLDGKATLGFRSLDGRANDTLEL